MTINMLCLNCHGVFEPRRVRKHLCICPYCHTYSHFERVTEPILIPSWFTGGICHPHFTPAKVYHKIKEGAL